ncbi:MAG: hypothetical protein ACYCYP_11785 [Leptospirales bacterium]
MKREGAPFYWRRFLIPPPGLTSHLSGRESFFDIPKRDDRWTKVAVRLISMPFTEKSLIA